MTLTSGGGLRFVVFINKINGVLISAVVFSGLTASPLNAAEDPASRKDYYFGTYARDARVKDNTFISECVDNRPLPTANLWCTAVPKAIWDGHPDEVAAFSNSWEMVGAKLHKPEANTNFKRNFVYTPFGKSVFVWGSSFITMFGQYASNVFPFIEQLDNFYAAQTPDGFIPRQLGIYDGRSQFERNDLSSVGGNIFAWAELEWYRFSGDKERLKRVYPVLMAYHDWMRKNRTWKDGTYFSSGWGCGMDNIPRMDTTRYSTEFHHGFISFVDVTMQQIFNAKNLLAIADLAGIARDKSLEDEIVALEKIANEKMWDEATGLYHDLDREGNRVSVRHIGGFWALLARVAPPERARRLASSLADGATFASPCGTRSLAKGEDGYERDGGNYWRGGVWCITDWAIVRGLAECGLYEEAHKLAMRHVCAVAKVYADTGTVWESYDPEKVTHGKLYGQSVRRDFVGFSGVTPIAMLVRDVFGMEFTPGKVVWRVRLLERHGIENLTLPDGNVVSLICEKRSSPSEKPVVKVLSDKPFKVEVK